MSNHSRSAQQSSPESTRSMMSKAEKELHEGFVEVEITGLSLRRLVSVYAVLCRQALQHSVGSIRTLLRADAAHQA